MNSNKNENKFDYDVALSFAGEDRHYVEVVAEELKSNGIKVFYDKYEEINLWGNNLYDHLDEVYSKMALFCIIFISEDYAKKAWTNHERKSIQSRALIEEKEYILPARFDSTEIPGLKNVSYIDLSDYSPFDFADIVIRKLKNSDETINKKLRNYIPASQKFNFLLDGLSMEILISLQNGKHRYRAINKIAKEVEEEKDIVRKTLDILKEKGLVKLTERTLGPKWSLTKDGINYLKFYRYEFDEES